MASPASATRATPSRASSSSRAGWRVRGRGTGRRPVRAARRRRTAAGRSPASRSPAEAWVGDRLPGQWTGLRVGAARTTAAGSHGNLAMRPGRRKGSVAIFGSCPSAAPGNGTLYLVLANSLRCPGGSGPCWSRSSLGLGLLAGPLALPAHAEGTARRSWSTPTWTPAAASRSRRRSPLPATCRGSCRRSSRPARTWSATGSTCRTSATSPPPPVGPRSPRRHRGRAVHHRHRADQRRHRGGDGATRSRRGGQHPGRHRAAGAAAAGPERAGGRVHRDGADPDPVHLHQVHRRQPQLHDPVHLRRGGDRGRAGAHLPRRAAR